MNQKIKDFIRKDFGERVNGITVLPSLGNKKLLENFYNINSKYNTICAKLLDTSNALENNSIGYDWGSWSGKIREVFKDGVPVNFLSNSLISFTMVFKRISGVKDTTNRITILEDIFSEKELLALLLEDYIGKPIISNAKYKTSTNRTHHATHLGFYKKMTNNYFWNTESVIEFGGGYGNMARIIRKMNQDITYIIIDLPELLALQYTYLGSLEGESEINIVNIDNPNIVKSKINLVPSDLVYKGKISVSAESFISTWALSECPEYLQEFVSSKSFFGATRLLLASFIDNNNKLKIKNIKKEIVPFLDGNHEYWTR
jgi:hypothetical protein